MLVDLVTRTRARLNSDLTKVRMLQGEIVYSPGILSRSASGALTLADAHIAAGGNPALQVTESLRSALTAGPTLADVKQGSGVSVAATPAPVVSTAPAVKSTFSICLARMS